MSRPAEPELADSLRDGRGVQMALRSAMVSIAVLAPALWAIPVAYCLYLMLLLDLALPGRSGESLVGLVGMAAMLVALHALLLGKRQQILGAFAAVCDTAGQRLPQVRQDSLRGALLDGGSAALADAASLPFLIAILALIAGWVALIPLCGAAISTFVLITQARVLKRHRGPEEARRMRDASEVAMATQRDHLVLLGLADRAAAVMTAHRHAAALAHAAAARCRERARAILSVLAGLCLAGVAGAATWMAASDRASIGALAAALLLTFFVFQPLRRIAAEIDTLTRAAAEWRALREALDQRPAPATTVALPPPARDLDVTGIAVPVPGTRRLTLQEVTFSATAGDLVAVIGPAGSGKSILLKVLTGQVPHSMGTVRLDGAALSQWGSSALRRHIGYLPQVPGLMPGTVAQNIAGFTPAPDPVAVTRAALAAGAHDVIVRLPAGYDTVVGDPDQPAPALSVQQRIALARALYGDPFLVLLDNPGIFQDNEGHLALRRCLAGLRTRGAVTVVVEDSASIIESANLVLVMRKGGMLDFGLKEDVRARLAERQRREAERLAEMSVCADPRGVPAGAPMVE